MTKEEIQAQIDLMIRIYKGEVLMTFVELHLLYLTNLKTEAKSIQDLQKEAFEAGREVRDDYPYPLDLADVKYETFEDYLKSKEK